MPTATETFNSTDTPQTAGFGGAIVSVINVPSSAIITNVTCTVDIVAPDEGAGPDPSLLNVYLLKTDGPTVYLHLAQALSLVNITYDTDRNPSSGSMNEFDTYDMTGDWTLVIENLASATTDLTTWSLNITYSIPDNVPRYPAEPEAPTLESAQYGPGVHIRKNAKLFFNVNKPIINEIIDNARSCPFNANMESLIITANNTGASTTTKISLHRVANGVDSILLSQSIILPTGLTYYSARFPSSYSKGINKGDMVYLRVDDTNSTVSNVSLSLALNQRD